MIRTLFGRALLAVSAAAFVTGCAANSPQMMPATRLAPGAARAASSKPILYVADLQNSVIRLYDPTMPNPTPEASITVGISSPAGIAVDAGGSLYVSNVGSSAITVYSPGATKPRLSIPTIGFYGIAVDSKGDVFGTVAGSLYGYRHGKKKPFEKIATFDNLTGIAVDSKDNVWVADDTASKVYTIPAGTKQVKDAGLKGLDSPIGLSFGSKDTLYVSNYANRSPPFVAIYASGSKMPSSKITDGIASPTLSGLTASGMFFQSNQTDNVVGYKKGQKTPFSTITGLADPLGIASYPLVKK